MARFQKGQSGNPAGRPKGIIDKRALLKKFIEPYNEDLVIKAVNLALNGNEQMLRLLLSRVLPATPREEIIPIDIDLDSVETYSEKCKLLDQSISNGKISLVAYKTFTDALTKRYEAVGLDERLTKLEEKANEKGA